MKQVSKFLILVFFLSLQAQAKTSDMNQPLYIQAGSVEIREQEGISIYKDNVHITRGTMIIEGELIHLHTTENQIRTIRVEGTPAKFRQLNDQDEEISAQSLQMKYQAHDNKLILTKDAVLVQGQNRFTSEHIVYDTQQDIVQAGDPDKKGDATESERVTITIQPDKKKNSE